jgi:hypothetical protein
MALSNYNFVKIDAVNAILKSINEVLSVFFLHFASHWDTFCYGNIHKKYSELLSFVKSGAADAILFNCVFMGCCHCMYFLKIKL